MQMLSLDALSCRLVYELTLCSNITVLSAWQRRSSVHEKKDAIASREAREEAERLLEAIMTSTKDEDEDGNGIHLDNATVRLMHCISNYNGYKFCTEYMLLN